MSPLRCPRCSASNSEFNLACTACGAALPQDSGDGPDFEPEPAPAAAEPLPALADGGRYELLELLGRGAMGAVYRARRRHDGQLVALKTVHGLREEHLPRLRDEIQALARLQHPGIVRILDSGASAAVPWYAMELVAGPSLRAWAHEQRPRPDAASLELLGVLRRLCDALAYLHGEGLIHGDLKPDNILLRNSPFSILHSLEPVLVDFGLAAPFAGTSGREALRHRSGTAGTVLYMAPEQIEGELLDARADLYSLGCILYELFAGRPPFRGSSALELLAAHLQQAPQPPSSFAPRLSPKLDELVLHLLAKRPGDRLGYAADVAAVLAAHGGRPGLASRCGPPRTYLYRPALAGREPVLHELRELLGSAQAPLVVFVGGESGVGKTRLALELARHESARRTVLAGECLPPASPQAAGDGPDSELLHPFRKLLQAVADRCRQEGLAGTELLLGRRGSVLALYAPELEDLPGQAAYGPVAELAAAESQRRLYTFLLETLCAYGGAAATGEANRTPDGLPLLLLLDDLQWADELTLGLLEFLLREPDSRPAAVHVVGLYRSEEPGSALTRLLEEPGGARLVRLGRLDEEATGRLVRDMLALPRTPPEFVRFLASHSEGNPFFIGEYLRTAVAEKLLFRDELGRWQVVEASATQEPAELYRALPLPGSLRELVGRRLADLGTAARRLAGIAAVLGRELDRAVLARISGLAEAELARALDALVAGAVLEPEGAERERLPAASGSAPLRHAEAAPAARARHTPSAGPASHAAGPSAPFAPQLGGSAAVSATRLRFAHDKLREVAYELLEPDERRVLHRKAAEALEALHQPERDVGLAALGHHFEHGGVPGRASACYLRAARQARARFSFGEAERLYRAALTLAPDAEAPELIEARNELGMVLLARGKSAEALAQHETALDRAQRLGSRLHEAQSLFNLGRFHRETGGLSHGQELLEQALAVFRELGERDHEGEALNTLALSHMLQGASEKARSLYEQALALHREIGNRRAEGDALANLAVLEKQLGHPDLVQTLYEQALTIHQEVGNRRSEAATRINLAVLHQRQGRAESAAADYQKALVIARDIGDLRLEGEVLSNLASLRLYQGLPREALELYEQALELHRRTGHRRFEGIVLVNLADLHHGLGDAARAGPLYEQALNIHRKFGNRPFEGITLANWAGMLGELGDVERARQRSDEALALFHELGRPWSEAEAMASRATLERRLGELDLAESLLDRAEPALHRFQDVVNLALSLCDRGHLALARGGEASSLLREARALAESSGATLQSELRPGLLRLERAVAAAEAGQPLLHGECPDDLPARLRQRVEAASRRGARAQAKDDRSRLDTGEGRNLVAGKPWRHASPPPPPPGTAGSL